MVHIVISVLTVSADAVQIFKCIKVFNKLTYAVIGVEVCRVSLLHLFAVAVKNYSIGIDNTESEYHEESKERRKTGLDQSVERIPMKGATVEIKRTVKQLQKICTKTKKSECFHIRIFI